MDWFLTHHSNAFLAHHDTLEDAVTGYERLGELLFVLALLLLLLVLRRAAVAAAVSVAAALAAGAVIARLVDRPRPFVTHAGQVHLFARHAADAGFPSDHATAAFAIAAAVFAYERRAGSVLLGLAALLALGRVAIGVHYPTDVAAGALLGTLVAALLTHGSGRATLDRLADRIPGRPAVRVGRTGAPR
jgi:undecaprenyl-diphosphatase